MSSETTPIPPARFAAALKDLSLSMLHLKVLELRNSIAHLDYSNEQLRPFAEGTEPSVSPQQPDPDCADAIRENEVVIARMQERIALVKTEVEERGASWTEFMSKEEVEERQQQSRRQQTTTQDGERVNGTAEGAAVNGEAATTNGEGVRTGGGSNPWTDGTFQTGTIRNGEVRMDPVSGQGQRQGGSLTDEELRRRLEEQMGNLGDDEEEGMHL
ncbi:hypothetical protein GE09DRAFT_419595 [Coniochaeta sp. 2T2.1]|nr:hypothetical protein GE09DRAFT_419595 [Coniochaeta sp. 2T2.1]